MHLVRVLNALDREQFEPAVAVTRNGGSYEAALAPDVPIFRLGGSGGSSALSVALAMPRLRALVQDFQPEVVCSVMDHVNLAALLTVHSLRSHPPLVLCTQVNPAAAYKARSPLGVVVRLAIRHLYHRADRVVSLSAGVASELVRRNGRLSSIVEVIPNAALDESVRRAAANPVQRTGVRPGEHLLVACGRLVPQKGYGVMLEALAIMRNQASVHLWILGDGPERSRLVARAKELKITEHVTFLGFQSEPWRYMAAADVFVLSSFYEGFGNVIAEAMACGVPVVATDCPYGPAEIITHGADGLLVPPRDSGAFAAAVLRLLKNPAEAAELAANGARRAHAFQSTTVAHRYGVLLREVAGC